MFLLVVTFFTNFFISKQRALNKNLALQQENESLLAELQAIGVQEMGLDTEYISAKIFSTYPFNIKNQLTINKGIVEGVEKFAAVTLGGNILVGQISEVLNGHSIVKTVFDPSWSLPVRIGQQEVDGLLEGGSEPKIVLIEKEQQITVGDIVFSAGEYFPYGIKIGEVAKLWQETGAFQEAGLKIPYTISELREVVIIK